jgi:hypothetical protein
MVDTLFCGDTWRMTWLPVSATMTLLLSSVLMPSGVLNFAWVPEPSAKPAVPAVEPATVVTAAFEAAIRRMALLLVSATKMLSPESVVTSAGQ